MSLECDGLGKRKDFTIPRQGDEPFLCPGCLHVSNLVPIEHQCDEFSFSYKTPRATCPFCDEVLREKKGVTEASQSGSEQNSQASEGRVKPVGAHAEKDSRALKAELGTSTVAATVTTRRSGGEQKTDNAIGRAQSKVRPLIIGGVFLIFLTAAIFGWLSSSLTTTSNTVANQSQGPATLQPAQPVGQEGMVYVSGATFQMGNDAGDEYEKPLHKVNLEPFLIDANEVTCEDYQKFVKEASHRLPPNWINGQYPKGAARKPVTGVDWDDANAYARWARKRLPSEAEWEFAARGTTGWRYPWGNDWRDDAANASDSNARQFADVGSYPAGKGPFGTMDMIGNAWEWTSTEWKGYPGGPVPPDASNELRVIRGGYWGSSAAKATTTFRRGWDARGAKTGYENTGFRCAADVNAQTSQK